MGLARASPLTSPYVPFTSPFASQYVPLHPLTHPHRWVSPGSDEKLEIDAALMWKWIDDDEMLGPQKVSARTLTLAHPTP